MMVCMTIIPVMWYLFYAPIHELSHLLGAYLVGARIVEVKLIPSFWRGETAVAWIRAEGFTSEWTRLIMTSAPYVLDLASVGIGIAVLHPARFRKAMVTGSLFMLLCLRPTFDLVCETVGFAGGFHGDLLHIALTVGDLATWIFLAVSLSFSLFGIIHVIRRFEGSPTIPLGPATG